LLVQASFGLQSRCHTGTADKKLIQESLTSNFSHPRHRRTSPLLPRPDRPAAHFRILLVEDHQATRELLAQLLTRSGHSVSGAETIAQGRLLAKTNQFDIVISDIGLPDGRGHDLMRELKRDFSLPGIALSGYGMELDILQSHQAGFSAHLTKPVDLAVLEEAIQRALNHGVDSYGILQDRSRRSFFPSDRIGRVVRVMTQATRHRTGNWPAVEDALLPGNGLWTFWMRQEHRCDTNTIDDLRVPETRL
jgi:CheY-like chemotaxis protein